MSVYTDAIDILNVRGWNQGRYEDPETGSVCVLGALTLAVFGGQVPLFQRLDDPDWVGAYESIEAIVREKSEFLAISAYNDDSSTTAQDVVLLLQEAEALSSKNRETELVGV